MKKLFLAILFTLGFMGHLNAQNTTKELNIKITDLNGKTYKVTGTPEGLKISGMEGKVIFLEFFGNHCPPCLASIPHLISLKKKYKDKLKIIAIEVQGDDPRFPMSLEQLKIFIKRAGINYSVFSIKQNRVFVHYIQTRSQWGGAIPFLVVVDTKGEVRMIHEGFLPEETLDNMIQSLIKEKIKKK
ncbi:MAG: TlpA family protein disulfide reductase [Sulfurovum sp.]|nr:TlpA family protein disulfide reductase [Sulfurovum sp.]MCB4744850.1 TlpA family protein disulfide reductase [Sulfurovum sp.]MCB4745791.1 TlpA family protein disulfide reductase [Sulfurovum sp.]MCB4748623.1 TlpA family protein disulfide reductase [Sulfurovum sp.]MCB4750819.1 TlpA family protein disulfide reductase [Sulfurovum sp.]